MTPHEIADKLNEFAKEVGPKADVQASVGWGYGRDKPIYCSVYPDGITGKLAIGVHVADWPEMFATLRAEWKKRREEFRRKHIKAMAMEIIRLTHEFGECTDAALRGEKYTDEDVRTYGDDAITLANEMASNGPFAITAAAKSNAA
jgi:hypothetical protein